MRVFIYFAALLTLTCIALYKVGDEAGWWEGFKLPPKQTEILASEPNVTDSTNETAVSERITASPQQVENNPPSDNTTHEESDVTSIRIENQNVIITPDDRGPNTEKDVYLSAIPASYEAHTERGSFFDATAIVKGKVCEHSMVFASGVPTESVQEVAFKLGGAFRMLKFGFGFSEESTSFSDIGDCTLTVVCDGTEVWRSRPISAKSSPQFCLVPINGANELVFHLERRGVDPMTGKPSNSNGLSPFLIEPLLSR